MEIIRSTEEIHEAVKRHALQGRTVGFVPTMGALHKGHLSLVKRAGEENDVVVVSIFVNPTQFGPKEDFSCYPCDFEGDSAKLESVGADLLFFPDGGMMYPEGFGTVVTVQGISEKLCGRFRPGHFTGVATVVCKLLNIVAPTRVYFGQKDFQQTVVISRMAADLNMDVELVTVPTMREADGLAMSSRNVYLSPKERKAASALYRALDEASGMIKYGKGISEAVSLMNDVLAQEELITEIQYAGVYDPESLEEITELKERCLLAIAVMIGRTRLIDNMLLHACKG